MADSGIADLDKKKSHRERRAGRKSEKKKKKNPHEQELTAKQRNPKAFTFNSVVKAERKFRRAQDLETKKQHIPLIDRTPLEPPPVIIAIVGPPKVGKSTLIQCLVKNFAKQPLTSIKGPVTIVSGKKRRLTLIECNNDINCMIDIAKVADMVLLLVDASFGFEMEIFEFLNICQVHGMPRIMGVLTHLDALRHNKALRKKKRQLKHRFWTEVYPGAKLFYLSGQLHGEYMRNEIKNLGRFISVMKFRPLTWRTSHPYILADRMEDLTSPDLIRQNPKVDRKISLYGYVRGVPLNKINSIHIPGCGDHRITEVSLLPDPCPLPEKTGKRRSLVEKDRYIYAPFSGVGGIVYDKDAVYVELGGSHSHKEEANSQKNAESSLMTSLLDTQETLDVKMARSEMKIFSNTAPISAEDFNKEKKDKYQEEIVLGENGRLRRKVVFSEPDNEEESASEDEDKEEENDNELDSESESSDEEGQEKVKTSKKKLIDSNENSSLSFRPPWTNDNDGDQEEEILQYEDTDDELDQPSTVPAKKQTQNMKDAEMKLLKEMGLKEEQMEVNDIDDQIEPIDQCVTKESNVSEDTEDSEYSLDEESDEEDGKVRLNEKKPKKTNKSAISDENIQEYRKVSSNKDKSIHGKICDTLSQLEEMECDKGSDSEMDSNPSSSEESEVQEDEDAEDSNDDGDEKGMEESAAQWKRDLAEKASNAYYNHQNSASKLRALVYGNLGSRLSKEESGSDTEKEDGEEVGGLFRVVRKKQHKKADDKFALDGIDSVIDLSRKPQDWNDEEKIKSIRNCFVTGKWGESENAEDLLKLDDFKEDEDESIYGDFEDLETGEKHSSKPSNADGNDDTSSKEKNMKESVEDKDERQRLAEKKLKLKEQFNAEYDEFGRGGGDKSFYEELKQEADMQSKINQSAFEHLDDSERVLLEGYRPGMYLRVELDSVPCELVTNFDPTYPLIIGGLLPGEENIGYVQVRLKKHRWYKKILKTRDPLIISLGWRRFQTLPLYSKLEDNLRNRLLKYTPEHVHCMAHFWGPITPQSTGLLAIQDVAKRQAGFRITATGSVVELDKSTCIMKKLKLIGTPLKIYKKTAFIQGMFNSSLEVARFEGAKIKTVSGIRGQIKKAVSKPEGSFRASFEDKIQLSDIIFCRTWYKVDVPQFYNPVTSLLLPPELKNSWQGMKTVGQLKREKGIHAEPAFDSLYTTIKRTPKTFRPLVIPRSLQKELPYKDRPKIKKKQPGIEDKRIAVIHDPHEQRVAALMKRIKTTYEHKQLKLKAEKHKKMEERKKLLKKEEEKRNQREKIKRKIFFRSKSKKSDKKIPGKQID